MTKEERKEYYKKYYLENKDKILKQNKDYREKNKEYYKKYYLENKDKILKKNTQYYKKNKVKILNQHKEWRLKNFEKNLQINREWRIKNKEYLRQYKKEYYLKLKAKKNKEIVKLNNQILKTINKPKPIPEPIPEPIPKRKERKLTETQIRLREILKDSHAISALCKLLSTNHNKRNNK